MSPNKSAQSPQRVSGSGSPPVQHAAQPLSVSLSGGVPPGAKVIVVRKKSGCSAMALLGSFVLIGVAVWFAYSLSLEKPVPAPAPVAQEPEEAEEPEIPEPAPEPVEETPEPPPPAESLEDIVAPEKIPLVAKPVEARAPLPSYNNFTYEQLRQATRDRFGDRRWKEHNERLTQLALDIIQKKKITSDASLFTAEFENKILPYTTVQIAFIRRIGEKDIETLSTDSTRPLAAHLFTNLPLLENFYNALSPQDNALNAVKIWAALFKKDTLPLERVRNENLAIALALVHDAKNDVSTAEKAFDYYRGKQKRGLLYLKFSELLPDELVWSVAPWKFSFDEYEWSLKPGTWTILKVEGVTARNAKTASESRKMVQNFRRIRDKYERVAGAYGVIRYDANHPYPEYTMKNILRLGGVCENQTDFSVAFARARAVPAGAIGGEEPSGIGHAWCIFRGKTGWRTTGRLQADMGRSHNPQTGQGVTESSFYLYNDKARKDGKYAAALRLVRIAKLLNEKKEREKQLKVLEAAVHRCPGQPVFWEEWFTALAADGEKIPEYTLRPIIERYRKQFKSVPDFYYSEAVENLEIGQLFSQWSDYQIRNFMRIRRRQMIKDYPNRFDLILRSVKIEAAQLKKAKQPAQIRTLLEDVADDFGEKSLRDFDRLFDTMDVLFKEHELPESARQSVLGKMMRVFEKHHFSGKLNLPKENPATLAVTLTGQNRQKGVFLKFIARFKELKAESLRSHAETKMKVLDKNIEGIQKILDKISKKMVGEKKNESL